MEDFVDELQASGRYTFKHDDARSVLGQSRAAFNKARRRLIGKRRLASPRQGFSVIVPLEYRSAGAPPAPWFIDDLMTFQRTRYYVGLLSAAALYGAAHQQPQVFQVVASKPLRPVGVGRTRIHFFTKRHITQGSAVRTKTETGSMQVSTPEVTALDLVRYSRRVGSIGSIVVVLQQLADRLDGRRLVTAAAEDVELASAQRLGYLLEHAGASRCTAPLARWVADQSPRPALLRHGGRTGSFPIDRRWHIVVNDDVGSDE